MHSIIIGLLLACANMRPLAQVRFWEWVICIYIYINWVYCACSGPWPFNLSFLSFSFLIGWEFYGPNYLKCSVKTCALGRQRRFPPSVPAVAGRQLVIVWLADSGESLHFFLVGANKSYAIATSDLWLFIHASNLLPLLPTPHPYKYIWVLLQCWSELVLLARKITKRIQSSKPASLNRPMPNKPYGFCGLKHHVYVLTEKSWSVNPTLSPESTCRKSCCSSLRGLGAEEW